MEATADYVGISHFRLGGIALFLSAADGYGPRLYCVGSGMPIGESLLNVWFRRCSAVVGSSSVSEFA